MNKKDYEAIAKLILKHSYVETREYSELKKSKAYIYLRDDVLIDKVPFCNGLIQYLRVESPLFDEVKFRKDCGD